MRFLFWGKPKPTPQNQTKALFHAQILRPELPSPQIEAELNALTLERDSGPANEFMVDAFERMGKEKYERYIHLRKLLVQPIIFAEELAQAREAMPNSRFIQEMSLPLEIAFQHVISFEEVVTAGIRPAVGRNFAFTGKELMENQAAWNLSLVDLVEKPLS